jgi:putative NADH-flavin reductase
MAQQSTFLVLGATGGTGKHFVAQVLAEGHRVRALVRSPEKLTERRDNLDVRRGSITDPLDTDDLVADVDFVVSMLGDKVLQRSTAVNTEFFRRLIPSMRRRNIKRLLYQAGGFSRPSGGHLSPVFWVLRNTVARSFDGQHRDNEAVMDYLAMEANDIEWIVHRAGIGSDGPSRGDLSRSSSKFSIAPHVDCASYNYRTVMDAAAVHSSDLSYYTKG